MKPIIRILIGIALALVGILTAAFFGLLLLIADCSSRCQANHEQLLPVALVVVGVAVTVVGVLLLVGRLGGRPASARQADR
jgi:ABC-type enterochelin transport system permease subunit